MEYLQYETKVEEYVFPSEVLNLIINGIPSILYIRIITMDIDQVLNLIINGIPSIHYGYPRRI